MITLPFPDPSLMPNRKNGSHWGKTNAVKKKAVNDAFYITKSSKPINIENGLQITFYTPTKHRRDNDNLLAAMKPYLDGFAQAIGIDDTNFNPLVIKRIDGVGKKNARVEIEGVMRKRRDFDYANYCLEKWAEWTEDDNGFPARSPTAKYGELKAHRAESSLPTNIEPNSRDIDRAILVLGLMKASSSKSAEYAEILKKVNRSRCNDESIKQAMERLEVGKGEAVYYMALDEFTMRLEVLIYTPKDTQGNVKALNEKIKPCITHEF